MSSDMLAPPLPVVARLPAHRAESSSGLVLRSVAEVVVAVVAASTQSLHRPAQISASPLAHTGEGAAVAGRRLAAQPAWLGPSSSTPAPMPISTSAAILGAWPCDASSSTT